MTSEAGPSPPSPGESVIRNGVWFHQAATICGGAAAVLGAIGLLGMFTGFAPLSAVIPGYKTMSILAGLSWILLGGCIVILANRRIDRTSTMPLSLALWALAVLGALELPLNLLGKHFILEDLLYASGAAFSESQASHISAISVVVMILAAIALFTLLFSTGDSPKSARGRNIAGGIALFLLLIGLTFDMSYLYGTPFLLGTAIVPVSVISVLAICCTGTGLLLLAGPRAFPLKYFSGTDTRAQLMRTFIPLVFVIILLQNLVQTVFFETFAIPEAIVTAVWFVIFSLAIGFTVGRAASVVGRNIDTANEEKNRALDALQESEDKYRTLVEKTNEGIFIAQHGMFVYANPQMSRLLGVPLAELIGKPFAGYIWPDDRDVVVSRHTKRISGEDIPDSYDFRIIGAGNRMRWVYLSAARIMWKGRPATINMLTDITDRTRAEEAIRENQKVLADILESTLSGYWDWNIPAGTEYLSPAFKQMFGYRDDELPNVPATWQRLIYAEDLPGVMEVFDRHVRSHGAEPFYNTVRYHHRDGSTIWVICAGRVIEWAADGSPVRMVGCHVDITDRKKTEAMLRETNAYLGNLINYANAPIIVWDPGFRITRFNQAFENLTGHTEAEVLGQPLSLLFPQESSDSSLEKIRQALAGEHWQAVEIPVIDIEGGTRIVLWNSANILDEQGQVVSTIAQGTDITDMKRAEEELRRSEQRYRNVVEDQEEFICRFTPKGTHIFVNEAYCRYFGKNRDEILGHVFRPRIHPEDTEKVARFFAGLTTDHPTGLIEERIIMPDGTTRWQRWSNRAIFDERGRLTEYQSVGRDISAQKEAELALQDSRQMLADIIEFLPDATFVIDREGRVITWNRAMERMSGVPKEAMVGRGDHAYSVPFYGEARRQLLDLIDTDDEELQKKYDYIRREGKNLIAEVFTPKAYGGKGAYVWAVAAPVMDGKGNHIGAIESIRDISSWKRSETELAANERRLSLLFENMTEAVALHEIICDGEGRPVDYRFLKMNPAFGLMTGLKPDQLIGRTVREILPGIEQSWIDRYGEVALTGKAIVFEDYNADTKRYYRVTAYSPNLRQFACIFSDITEKRRAEQQREALITELEQKNAELERFTYTVSHDLKSPLITIHGFLGMLEEDALRGDTAQLKKDIGRISSAADKMQDLLSDLLTLSRIGRIVSPPSTVSFRTLALEAVELMQGRLTEREVKTEIAENLPAVHVDAVRIREALVNLIENSVKFMGDRKDPLITIGATHNGDQPLFFVRDNGIGIETEYQKRVFGLFEKLDTHTEGTGVGLAIVHRIIEVHGGRIWIESAGPGTGTTVYFTLPVPGSTCLYTPNNRTNDQENTP